MPAPLHWNRVLTPVCEAWCSDQGFEVCTTALQVYGGYGYIGVEAKLVRGSGGVFDVEVDSVLLYSKAQTGRYPEDGEISALIQRLG